MFSHLYDLISIRSWNLLAQDDATADAVPEAGAAVNGGDGSMFGDILNNPLFPLVGLFLLFYFIFILPERRRKADETKMMASLKKNDRIVTIGGIHATVVSVAAENDVVTIKIDEAGNTRVKLNRSAIARIVKDGDGKNKDMGSGSKDLS